MSNSQVISGAVMIILFYFFVFVLKLLVSAERRSIPSWQREKNILIMKIMTVKIKDKYDYYVV